MARPAVTVTAILIQVSGEVTIKAKREPEEEEPKMTFPFGGF
jgi:hypothetical protein